MRMRGEHEYEESEDETCKSFSHKVMINDFFESENPKSFTT